MMEGLGHRETHWVREPHPPKKYATLPASGDEHKVQKRGTEPQTNELAKCPGLSPIGDNK